VPISTAAHPATRTRSGAWGCEGSRKPAGERNRCCPPQASGRQKQSVALTPPLLQRRLASSTHAIHQSLRRRLEKQSRILDELTALPPGRRARYLGQLRGRVTDTEQDEDDLGQVTHDHALDAFTAAQELEQHMGRVHRIGRERDVHVVNFVADRRRWISAPSSRPTKRCERVAISSWRSKRSVTQLQPRTRSGMITPNRSF
jgi:hypothetical protein